jgi:hypothetical protein
LQAGVGDGGQDERGGVVEDELALESGGGHGD